MILRHIVIRNTTDSVVENLGYRCTIGQLDACPGELVLRLSICTAWFHAQPEHTDSSSHARASQRSRGQWDFPGATTPLFRDTRHNCNCSRVELTGGQILVSAAANIEGSMWGSLSWIA